MRVAKKIAHTFIFIYAYLLQRENYTFVCLLTMVLHNETRVLGGGE